MSGLTSLFPRGYEINDDNDLGRLVANYVGREMEQLKDFWGELEGWREKPTELAFQVEDYAIDRGWYINLAFADVVSHCIACIAWVDATAEEG